MSNQQQALNLAVETLSEIFKDSTKTSTILRRCLTISTLLGKEKEQEWIRTELEGYKESESKFAELKEIVPSARANSRKPPIIQLLTMNGRQSSAC